jgi:hypothetical protein
MNTLLVETDAGLRWEAAAPHSSRHETLAGFVREAYRQHFGAKLNSVMPELCAIVDPDGLPRAVAGIRHAADGPLFAEQYLARPLRAPAWGCPSFAASPTSTQRRWN